METTKDRLEIAKVRLEDAKRRLALSTERHVFHATDHVTIVGEEFWVQCREDGVRSPQHLRELRAIVAEAGDVNLFNLAQAAYDAMHKAIGSSKIDNCFGRIEISTPFHLLSEKMQGYWIEVAKAVVEKMKL